MLAKKGKFLDGEALVELIDLSSKQDTILGNQT